MKLAVSIFLGLCFLLTAHASDSEIEMVRNILKSPRRDWSKLPTEEHAADMKPFGNRAIPLLATFLNDYWLGDDASDTMLTIDPIKAGPLIFASMPQSNRNVQRDSFNVFLGLYYHGKKVPFPEDIHDAAVRCIKAGIPADAAESAIYSLAFTGDASDFPFLEQIYNKNDPNDPWGSRLRKAAESVLARLGNQEHLAKIEANLAKPIPNPMTVERAGELMNMMDEAGFTQSTRFIPLLCRHLDDPLPNIPPSDVGIPDPGDVAVMALDQIIGQIPLDEHGTDEDRVKWWKENRSKFAK